MKEKFASFLVPLLTVVVLLYQVLTDLQIAVTQKTTLLVIGVSLAVAAALGIIAAIGPAMVRIAVLALCTLLFIDVTFSLPTLFDRMHPTSRKRVSKDETRVADLQRLKAALDEYVAKVGPLPLPKDYAEAAGKGDFWASWWDLSTDDGDGDGVKFLDFLVEDGILTSVPVDPVNEPSANGDPRGGKQYVFFLVPPEYNYGGGACDSRPQRWHYLLAITDLEYDPARPPLTVKGSGCTCLWRDQPNFFQEQFDYVLCGSFDATPESLARAAERRAKATAAALIEKQRREAKALAAFAPQDQKRVADILRIRQGLQTYIEKIGPLPAPLDYGEAEKSRSPMFWQHHWDVSAEDGDEDGKPFLDFLVDTGIMPSVPVDPENVPAQDGDPRGGRQYAYFLVPPNNQYAGGSCASKSKRWVYMLGITDLRSELTRPPTNIEGSGCDCLWRDQPNFFQQHFDYVVCGTFEVTPAGLARAAEMRAKFAAQALAEKARREAKALAIYTPQDRQRVADILRIRQGLQTYLRTVGPLPSPREYGESEASRSPSFWQHAWDVSTEDGDRDGKPFLDFLVESGVMPSVPVDPENVPAPDGDPRGGRQYAYFLVPPQSQYQGGSCVSKSNQWVYMLGITDLRSELTRPPTNIRGSGCDCLWRNQPNFFQQHFDYVVCGTFEVTPESLARAAEARAQQAAGAAAEKARLEAAAIAEQARAHAPQDRRRVADILQIRQGLQTYLEKVGPLPAPRDYGESEASRSPNFWQHAWDVSAEDGDKDGKPFLDFLVESGVMPAVPVDPENVAGPDGDPRGGRQYAYFLVPPQSQYQGGSCVSKSNQWVYMLGITDLRSELSRPSATIAGSGCDCLWRDQPNFFQQHFDYVICGTFEVTPESLARAADARARQVAAAAAEKERAEAAALAEKARAHAAKDRQRVADLLRIRAALQFYLEKVGPLPAPSEYGESEASKKAGFWQHHWDVSAEDGDKDGKPFLDFLVDSGTMPSVPVDPDNVPSSDGDPRGGMQFAYFLVPPEQQYQGGSCAADEKQWVYLLGITDLRSESTRPPKDITGSGCDCLWRNQPNFFQNHFDYVVCGTFRR